MTLGETRAAARAEIGPLYSGLLHFAFTNLVGLGVIAYAAWQVREPRWSLLTVPVTFLYANAVEYFLHKGPMHHRAPLLRMLHARHTVLHHSVFTHDAMKVESARDFKLVLFPAWLVVFFFGLFAVPAGLALRLILGANVAALFVITAMAYFLLYEWFHLAAHLGFGRHHAAHHDPRAMTAHNFNITFPICDKLFGTCAPPPT